MNSLHPADAGTLLDNGYVLAESDSPVGLADLPKDPKSLANYGEKLGWHVEAVRRVALDAAGDERQGLVLAFTTDGHSVAVTYVLRAEGWVFLGWPWQTEVGRPKFYMNLKGVREHLRRHGPDYVKPVRKPRAVRMEECPLCGHGVIVEGRAPGRWAEHEAPNLAGNIRRCPATGKSLAQYAPPA